jgi:catalase-peroxidase
LGQIRLSNDYFVNLLDMGTVWNAISKDQNIFEGRDRETGEMKWTGTRVDSSPGPLQKYMLV